MNSEPTRRRVLTLGALSLLTLAVSCGSLVTGRQATGVSRSARGEVDAIRGGAGLAGLSPDSRLEGAAREQSGYMAASGRMNHTAARGQDFSSRMRRASIPAPAAENLAHGRMDMPRVFQMWMDSDGHRRNMLDPRFTRYGLAYAQADDGRRFWTLVLSV